MKRVHANYRGLRLQAVCALSALAAVCALLASCDSGRAVAAAAAEVSVAHARAADSDYLLVLPARAQAGQSAQIFARATGLVESRRVDIGDTVRAGQLLATIAAPEIDQAVSQARADVAHAEAELTLARGNHQRAAAMLRTELISREDYSSRLGARDAAQAAFDAARAQLASARARQGFGSVRAPFDGVVSARNVDPGDRVVGDSATATVPMFRIDALDPLRIAVDVPQSAVLSVQPGVRAQVSFRELPGQRFDAEVVRSALRISERAGGMRVELRLANPGNRIPAGMVGQVGLRVPRTSPVVLLPLAAVIQEGAVAKVARLPADGRVRYAEVTLGRHLSNEVEILAGLAVGDRVVLSPNALLADGARVRVGATR